MQDTQYQERNCVQAHQACACPNDPIRGRGRANDLVPKPCQACRSRQQRRPAQPRRLGSPWHSWARLVLSSLMLLVCLNPGTERFPSLPCTATLALGGRRHGKTGAHKRAPEHAAHQRRHGASPQALAAYLGFGTYRAPWPVARSDFLDTHNSHNAAPLGALTSRTSAT